MRSLKTSDIFVMSRILKKMNIDLDIKDGMTESQAGAMFIQKIAENLYLAENEVNEFMGELVGMSGEEFNELDIEQTFKYFNEFKNQKGLKTFFKLASK